MCHTGSWKAEILLKTLFQEEVLQEYSFKPAMSLYILSKLYFIEAHILIVLRANVSMNQNNSKSPKFVFPPAFIFIAQYVLIIVV